MTDSYDGNFTALQETLENTPCVCRAKSTWRCVHELCYIDEDDGPTFGPRPLP